MSPSWAPSCFPQRKESDQTGTRAPGKTLTILRPPSARRGLSSEARRSFNTEAAFHLRAIRLLVREARAWLVPPVAGSSALQPRTEFVISRCISKGIGKILRLSAGVSSPSLRQELNSCYTKGKAHAPEAEGGRCYKQTWAKGSLWLSHEDVIRGVRAPEYPSRYFL